MVLVAPGSRVIVQGITGREGHKHACRMLAAGTDIVGGVNPHKAGQVVPVGDVELPVFATCQEAVVQAGATVSVVFVPPPFVKQAVKEAVDAGIDMIVVITEGVPMHDAAYITSYANSYRCQLIGPNCPGLASYIWSSDSSSIVNIGIIPDKLATAGPIGLVSRSGTLTYEMLAELGGEIGFSGAIGIGGDYAIGTSQIDALKMFEDDPSTLLIVLIGEIGGNQEELAALYIQEHITKPVIAYIAGVTAPEGKTMGHAGAIIYGNAGSAKSKQEALKSVGVYVGNNISDTAREVRRQIKMLLFPL